MVTQRLSDGDREIREYSGDLPLFHMPERGEAKRYIDMLLMKLQHLDPFPHA